MIEATVRASSIGLLLDCAHAWEGVYLLGFSGANHGRSQLGTALHKSTAAYDRARAERSGMTRDEAAGLLIDAIAHPERDVVWDDISKKSAQSIGLKLHHAYCMEWSPRFEWTAIEMSLTPMTVRIGKVELTLTGTMDRARLYHHPDHEAALGIVDLKSGKQTVDDAGRASAKGHAPQIGVYEMLAAATLARPVNLPARIIGLKTVETPKPQIGEATIVGAAAQMVGTFDEPGILEMVAQYFESGLFPPNTRATICGERYCARWERCKFRAR